MFAHLNTDISAAIAVFIANHLTGSKLFGIFSVKQIVRFGGGGNSGLVDADGSGVSPAAGVSFGIHQSGDGLGEGDTLGSNVLVGDSFCGFA